MWPLFKSNEVVEVAEVVQKPQLPVITSIEIDPRPAFHPHLLIKLNTTLPPHALELQTAPDQATPGCKLNIDLAFPDSLFVDRDELRDALHDLTWALSPPTVDIERAVRPLEPLVHLALGVDADGRGEVDIPLHARYLRPSAEGREVVPLFQGGSTGQIRGGWVCGPAAARDVDLDVVPVPALAITLPAGRPSDQPIVELGTTAAIWLCFAYLAYKLYATSRRLTSPKQKTL